MNGTFVTGYIVMQPTLTGPGDNVCARWQSRAAAAGLRPARTVRLYAVSECAARPQLLRGAGVVSMVSTAEKAQNRVDEGEKQRTSKTVRHAGRHVTGNDFEPEKHFYPRVLNASLHVRCDADVSPAD